MAINGEIVSPAGDAFAILPPIVATFLILKDANSLMAFFKMDGVIAFSSKSSSVVAAPILIVPPSDVIPFNSFKCPI